MINRPKVLSKLLSGSRKYSKNQILAISAYGGAFVVVTLLIAANVWSSNVNGQRSAIASQDSANDFNASSQLPIVTAADAQTATIASTVATVSGLNVTDSVSNRSITMSAIVASAQTDVSSANKSLTASSTSAVLPISTYVVQNGDTAATIAAKFGVSDQTVRLANNLSSDSVTPETTLQVPMVNGVIYTIADGDTLATIAAKYNSNVDNIVTVNNLSSQNVPVGTRLLLPDGVIPATATPTTNASGGISTATSTATSLSSGSASEVGNRYSFGECTWYAYNRRVELGLAVGSFWGNANTWAINAANSGFLVNHTPSVGAIMQTTAGYYGHVAIVESVNLNGTITISEMNYVGWDRVDTRTVSNPSSFSFIH